ncbi:sensor histidine kinase [Tunturibacter empetritectus]|uniref:Signal transduction histidine kinase/ligand-binding sensor domain-containing protein n=1 Tax=Tunturiibacter empetritectus TaxID=3069691 RepID=A0A7W8MPT8_9BACT|nr:sensor histidine kinase [Edaphobacter lichenicola]MBB5316046.1 signal transduction histidine kinase/ligand-binding sensor domain-containing protein [Edaphobacter lichenicola]
MQERVTGLVPGEDGSLWIGTSAGLTHYEHGRFVAIANQAGLKRFPVDDLVPDHEGGLWVANHSRLFKANNHAFTPCLLPVDGHAGGLKAIAEATDRTLWVAGNQGVFALRGGKVSRHYGDAEGLPAANISFVDADARGNVYAGDGHRLFRLEGERFRIVQAPGLGNFVSLLTDHAGALWMASGGLHGISRNVEGTVDSFRMEQGLASNDARILFEDRSGDMWIGTIAGLQRLHNGRFTTYTVADGLPQGQNQYDAVFEDKGYSIWVGSLEDGVGRVHDGRFERFSVREGLKRGQVRGFADSDEGIVVAISDYGLFRLNGKHFVPIAGIPHGYITSPISDTTGALWFGLNGNGVFRLAHGSLRHFTTAEGLPGTRVSSLLLDEQGAVLVATNEGVAQFRGDRFVTIADIPVISIGRDDQRGGLWFGTGDGLVFWKSGHMRRITQAQGLPGNLVLAATTDDADNLWITTANAIAQVDRKQLDAVLTGAENTLWPKRFTQADGLGSRDVLPIGQVDIVRAHDGRIWLATANGLSVAETKTAPAPVAQVFVESIAIDEVLQQTADRIVVPPGRHRLTIIFTSPDLHSPEQLRFRYRLNGWDKDWLDAASVREITYTGLPPGDYQLRVVAANEDGVWSDREASVGVHIRPFFYQTKLFMILACLTLLASVIEITRRRTRYVAEQQRLRFQERAAERERIGYQIHDTIIQDLVGTALQLELIGMQIPENSEKTAYLLADLTARMREMVGKSRNMVSSLHSMATPQYHLLEVLREAAAEFRLGELPVLRLETRGKQPIIKPLVRDEVYRICREALANAFRHSNATRIDVCAAYTDEGIEISISDDGSGMDEETLRIGRSGHFGLSGMQAHAQRIGATVLIDSELNLGTTVRLNVPTPSRRWWHLVRNIVVTGMR